MEDKHYKLDKEESKKMTGYASIDKPWLKYYNFDVDSIEIPKMSMYQMAEMFNKNRLNNTAIELRNSFNNFKKGHKISYEDYFEKIKQFAKASYLLGIKIDEIVPMILPNIPESRISIYGLNFIGATPYALTPMLAPEKLERIIKENEIKNIILFSGFYNKYKNIINNNKFDNIIYVNGYESLSPIVRGLCNFRELFCKSDIDLQKINSDNIVSYKEFMKDGEKLKTDLKPYYNENHIAAIVGTSGTTGVPKGVCLTDYNLNSSAIQHISTGLFQPEDKFLDVLLQSIAYGLAAMHYTTCGGLNSILIPELVTDKIGMLLKKVKPDHFLGGPVHCLNVLRSDEYKKGEISIIKNYVSGGATLNKDIEKKLNNVSENYFENGTPSKLFVRQGLGSTENTGGGLYAVPGSYKFGGVGVPLPLENIGVFEPGTDRELPYNTPGELCICAPTVMKKYLNNLEETNKTLKVHSDGKVWLHMGDIGIIDEDGQFFHQERISGIFMRNGFNIHPNKIAEYIESLPFIKNCAVIGIEHPDEQMVPVAFISLCDKYKNENDINLIKSNIISLCKNNLDDPSIPKDIVVMDELPLNLGGKIELDKLRKSYGNTFEKQKVLKLKK